MLGRYGNVHPSILSRLQSNRRTIFQSSRKPSNGQLEKDEMDVQTIVYSSFCQVTAEDCCGWIDNSGIYNAHNNHHY